MEALGNWVEWQFRLTSSMITTMSTRMDVRFAFGLSSVILCLSVTYSKSNDEEEKGEG